MNVLIAINENCLKPVEVMLYSLNYHNTEHHDVYLMYCEKNLSEESINNLISFCNRWSIGNLYPIKVDISALNHFPKTKQFPIESYFRIFSYMYLPETVDRIIWLDADIIINGCIKELYEENMSDKCIVAVQDYLYTEGWERLYHKNFINVTSPYFNAGVMVLNIEKIKQIGINDLVFDIVSTLEDKLKYQDQDIMNIIFEKGKILVGEEYNYLYPYVLRNKKNIDDNVRIIHFVQSWKPWLHACDWKYQRIWWRYAKVTFGIIAYINAFLRHMIFVLHRGRLKA